MNNLNIQEASFPLDTPILSQLDSLQLNGVTRTDNDLVGLQNEFVNALLSKNIHSDEDYDIREDFKWFTSGNADTTPYRGQYIAIWKKNIIANAKTAVEVKKIAKTLYKNCRPAIVYVPIDENEIL